MPPESQEEDAGKNKSQRFPSSQLFCVPHPPRPGSGLQGGSYPVGGLWAWERDRVPGGLAVERQRCVEIQFQELKDADA